MKALIIEDNNREAEVVLTALSHCNEHVECVGIAGTVVDAVRMMHELEPELMFLDIELADGNGFDVLNACRDLKFKVIFVTAHDNYSIQAVRYTALDYIMKPIDLEDFARAVTKAYVMTLEEAKERLEILFQNYDNQRERRMGIWCQDGLHFIDLADIDHIRADGSYSRIHMNDGNVFVATKLLKEFEFLIDADSFLRPHNSYLVNMRHIRTFTKRNGGQIIMVSDHEIPVSRGRREDVLRRLGTWVV